MKNRSLTVVFVLLFSFLMVLPAMAGEVNVAFRGDAATLDPHMRDESTTVTIQGHIYEALLEFDRDGNLYSKLATDWTFMDDHTWRFHLREGVYFHNGEKFNADQVRYSIERVNVHPDSQMKHYTASIKEVNVIDDYTVDIVTHHPHPILANDLRNVFIVPKEYFEAHDDSFLSRNPVGTGPYTFVEWVRDNHITLEANEDWWGGDLDIKKVTFRPIPEDATRIAALLSGEIDIADAAPILDIPRIEQNPTTRVERVPSLRAIYLAMDVLREHGGDHPEYSPGLAEGKENPFLDLRVRQAFYHAINVDEIVEFVMRGSAYPAAQYAPEMVFGYVEGLERLPFDPDRARELLKEAGYEDGFTVRLDTPNDRYINDEQIGEAIVGQLAEVGIDVELNAIPRTIFFDLVNSRETSFFLLGWACGSLDMSSVLNATIHTTDFDMGMGRFNDGEYSNPEVDALIQEANRTLDPERRKELYEQAVRISLDEVAWIPLHFQENVYGVNDSLNWEARSDERIFVYTMSFKD